MTWTPRVSHRNWSAVTSSSGGAKLVAVFNGGQIYTSNNSGLSWASQDNSRPLSWVASSSDGNRLVAVPNGGLIHTSLAERTTAGTTADLSGSQFDAVELHYIGDNLFMPSSARSYSGGRATSTAAPIRRRTRSVRASRCARELDPARFRLTDSRPPKAGQVTGSNDLRAAW